MLEGKAQTLKKPLVVLSKIPMAGEGDEIQYKVGSYSGSVAFNSYNELLLKETDIMLQVVGIVREKYLFKSRPRAIISKPDIK